MRQSHLRYPCAQSHSDTVPLRIDDIPCENTTTCHCEFPSGLYDLSHAIMPLPMPRPHPCLEHPPTLCNTAWSNRPTLTTFNTVIPNPATLLCSASPCQAQLSHPPAEQPTRLLSPAPDPDQAHATLDPMRQTFPFQLLALRLAWAGNPVMLAAEMPSDFPFLCPGGDVVCMVHFI